METTKKNTPEKRKSSPGVENPKDFTGLKLGSIKSSAAGIPAVVSSMKHVIGEAGFFRGNKALLKLNQKNGFDCPSCAWPDPDDERSSVAEYCENGAKAVAEEATTKKLDADFFRKNSVASLGELTDYEIGRKGRLAEPMYLPKGATHYQPISWEKAFDKIGEHLNALDSPDEAIFYTSGRITNEGAFLYQLFVREYGTNNMPDCSNMCHESSSVALPPMVGIGKGSVKLEDFYKTEVIILMGQNPGTNHPRMLTALQKAKANGAMIISINPLPETGLKAFKNPQEVMSMLGAHNQLTDVFLQVKINGDMPLLQALVKLMLEEEEKNPGSVFDINFIRAKTSGYEEYIQHIKSLDLDQLIQATGISKAQLTSVAGILQHKKRIIICWAMGLTQHKNSVITIQEIVNLLLVKGSISKEGAGTCPVRGHSNVQGDRTMGIYEKPKQSMLDSMEHNFGFRPPQEHGYDTVESIKAMHRGDAKVFISMAGNFLSATPDTLYTAEALRKCKLTVNVSTKLNRSHIVHGEESIILPSLGRSDKDYKNGILQILSVENSMGVVHMTKGVIDPISDQMRSEIEIVCGMAKATLKDRSVIDWDKYVANYDHVRDDIARTIPDFHGYNDRLRMPGGFYLPNGSRDGHFGTEDGKAHFKVSEFHPIALREDELIMMTVRTHDQFNTTIYGLNDRYRGIYNERRVIMMNEKDMEARNLKQGDVVDLYNHHGGVERVAERFIVIPFPIPEKCTATYFPETNVLVPIGTVADGSGTPISKSVIITVVPVNEQVEIPRKKVSSVWQV